MAEPTGGRRRRHRLRRLLGLAALVGALAVGWRALRISLWRPAAASGPAADGLARFLLACHIHTDASDGRGSLEDVVSAARACGLDAVAITDHDTFALLGRAGYHDGVLVLVGIEAGTDDGHLVVLGTGEPEVPFSHVTAEAVAEARAAGGVAFAAHPVRRIGQRLRWRASLAGLDGVEVANLDAAWREGLRPLGWLGALAAYPVAGPRAVAALSAGEPEALALYDRALRHQALAALGAADAHGRFVSYRAGLCALANVLLLDEPPSGDARRDTEAVLEALRARRVLVSYRALGDPRGASLRGRRGEESYVTGDRIPAGAGVDFLFETGLARPADLRIVHEGVTVAAGRGHRLAWRAERPGAYRAEARLGGPFEAPWLLTSPIFLEGEGWPRPPGAPPAPPVPRLLLPPVSLLEGLQAEHDRDSEVRILSRPADGGPLRARLRLSVPTAATPEVWCALIDRTPRDLGGRGFIHLEGRADRRLRIDVAFTSHGERFRRSVVLDPTERSYRLALAEFRGRTDARRRPPPLGPVESIFVTVDRGTMRPPVQAEVEIGVLRLE